jgi:cyclopropane-fatty-acyl-phospholipid synthase
MFLLDKLLKALIREGALIVTDYDGSIHRYGDASAEPIGVRLMDRGAAWHIARNPRMGTGEAYTDGRLVVEPPHEIRDLVLFFMAQARRRGAAVEPISPLRRWSAKAASRLDQFNGRRRAKQNVEHHYELSRRFYELFLDEDRQYTMAYFRTPESTLERAQLDKQALIAAKLHLPRDASSLRVLDIGCGWGGLGLYLNRHYGCEVLGVSLAADQVAFANERASAAGVADRVKFQLIDYRDVGGTFDRITSVGMLEHVGSGRFGEYFAKTNTLLADDGVMLTHTIGRTGPPGGTDPWVRKYIFPGHYLPAMSELLTALENTRWKIGDIEVLRYHYAHTLAEWYRRTTLHEAEITEMFDARFFRMWQFYLAGAEQGFRNDTMVNFHIQSVKRPGILPTTRDYIQTEMERLVSLDSEPRWHLSAELTTAAE